MRLKFYCSYIFFTQKVSVLLSKISYFFVRSSNGCSTVLEFKWQALWKFLYNPVRGQILGRLQLFYFSFQSVCMHRWWQSVLSERATERTR